MLDSQPHRGIHLIGADLSKRDPPDFGCLAARGRQAPGRVGSEDDGELLADLAVAGIEHHVLRVGVDADQAGDLAVDAGLFPGFPDGGLGEGLAEADVP